MNQQHIILAVLAMSFLLGCSREDEDVVDVINPDDYPQLILLDDEGGGELEDSDEISVAITLADRYDPSREELGGGVFPLDENYSVAFHISEAEGFDRLEDFILGAEAFYEIDDCTTSLDNGENLIEAYDPATGSGSVVFPAGVEEIELVFTVNEEFFDDETLNDHRGFRLAISGEEVPQNVAVFSGDFQYEVLDDEAIFGEWELDISNTEQFARFKELFGLINEDVANLTAEAVAGITIEFGYDELEATIALTETETVEKCGETEEENVEIEISAGYDELTRDTTEGEIVLEDDVELDNGAEEEFSYEGSFVIEDGVLTLTLSGSFDGEETEEITLNLTR